MCYSTLDCEKILGLTPVYLMCYSTYDCEKILGLTYVFYVLLYTRKIYTCWHIYFVCKISLAKKTHCNTNLCWGTHKNIGIKQPKNFFTIVY